MTVGKIIYVRKNFPYKSKTLLYPIFENKIREDKNLKILDKKAKGKITEKIKKFSFLGKEGEILYIENGGFYQEIIPFGLGEEKNFSPAKYRNLLSAALSFCQKKKITNITTFYFDQLSKNFFEIGKELALAFYLANYFFDKYKSGEERKKNIRVENFEFVIEEKISNSTQKDFEKGVAFGKLISEGIYFTRDLVNEPAFYIHPESLAEKAFEIEKDSNGKIKVEVLDEDECRRLGMGAYLAVGVGSERKPKFIILKYQPDKTANKTICLIGKSITFDSGGLSLKPAEMMETMKIDMAGGATVLGVFKILSKLSEIGIEIKNKIYGILPACENMPSGKSIRPGDIVTALNGKTIEIINTDAEGRLTLADALSYAQRYFKPEIIIDLATLTGACMVALGTEITGMWGNDGNLNKQFIEIANKEKEELWEMPLYYPYKDMLKSEIADIKNVTSSRYGGAITASLFLQEFIEKTKWIHLDIAGSSYNQDKEKGIYKKGATGWGVLSLIEFLRLKVK